MLDHPNVKIIRKEIKSVFQQPENIFNPEKQVKFICKQCEMFIFVKDYDDIIRMEKTCDHCRTSENKDKRALLTKQTFLNINTVSCNNCDYSDTKNKFQNGAFLKCPKCHSFNIKESNPTRKKK